MFSCWMSVYQFTASRSGQHVVPVQNWFSCGYGAADRDWTCSETQTNLKTFQRFGRLSLKLKHSCSHRANMKAEQSPSACIDYLKPQPHFPKAALVWSLSCCNIRLWKFQAYFGLMCWTWHVPAALWLLNLCWEKKLDCSHRRRSWRGEQGGHEPGGGEGDFIHTLLQERFSLELFK